MVIPSIPTFNAQAYLRSTGIDKLAGGSGGGSGPTPPSGVTYADLVALSPIGIIYSTESSFFSDISETTPAADGDYCGSITNVGRGTKFACPYVTPRAYKRAHGLEFSIAIDECSIFCQVNNTTGAGWIKGTTPKLISMLIKTYGTRKDPCLRIGNYKLGASTCVHVIINNTGLTITQNDGAPYTSAVGAGWVIVQIVDDGSATSYWVDNVEVASGKTRLNFGSSDVYMGGYGTFNLAGWYANDDPSNREMLYNGFDVLRTAIA